MEPVMMDSICKYGINAYRYLLKPEDALLLVVDIQKRLFDAMQEDIRQTFLRNNLIIIKTAQASGIPIILTEQMPERFGETLDDIAAALGDVPRIRKLKFSCWREGQVMAEIRKTSRKTVIIAGMEAHVCILQTAFDLLVTGYTPVIAADAILSRLVSHQEMAVQAMAQAGAIIYPAETITLMLMESAAGSAFEEILSLLGWNALPPADLRDAINK